MQVLFESRDPGGALLREVAERRLRFVMRRLTWLVPRARLQLSDATHYTTAPHNAYDYFCRCNKR